MNYLKSQIPALVLAFGALLVISAGAVALRGQSSDQNFPTPVTGSEISGTIRARDIGDARLTSYFYVFNGNQGDVFINVVTKNLNGDIDVFTADGLRPLTKIVVYADNSDSETGRVVYVRQSQRMILRVEGRTPDDNPATFRIKFAGSFAPAAAVAETEASRQPEVRPNDDSDVRVNSVGTIISVKPKPTPTPRETVARREPPKPKPEPRKTVAPDEEKAPVDETVEERKPAVVVTEPVPPTEKRDEPDEKTTADGEKSTDESERKKDRSPEATTGSETEKPNAADEPAPRKTARAPKREKTPSAPKSETRPKPATDRPAPVEPALLENIRLVVVFKDGGKIERAMSGILRFGVDRGILTIIFKDGSIARYSILDVAKMTVE